MTEYQPAGYKPGIAQLIFGRIWAAWGALIFVLTMLIMLVPFYLFAYRAPEPKRTLRFIRYARVWMAVYLPLIGCPLRSKGKEHFKKGQNYVVVCNHNSFMDVPITSPAIPGGNKTIAKAELARTPLFGALYKAGSVLVNRKSDASRKESFAKMKKVLDMGLNMCIYPEGTRNLTDAPLKPFHDGAFRLACDTGKPIMPALIFNTRRALPKKPSFYLMPGPLEIHFLAPIEVGPEDSTQTLKDKAFGIMETYYAANRKS
jgi:1-acyl-sn-glycerol-3-phosphate acyltransferase